MNVESLNSLEHLPLDQAQRSAISMLDKNTKPTRLLRLKHDIMKARTAREVMRIMWNAYMAGTGYAVPTSHWQKHYKSA